MRAKVLALVALALLLTTAALYVVAETVLKRSCERLELTLARADIARVRNAFAQSAAALTRTALDWAMWHDAYRFIADHNEAYVATNLGDTAVQNLRLNLMLFANPGGQVVHVKQVGLSWQVGDATAARLGAQLKPDLAVANSADQEQFHGLVSLPEAELLFAAVPVRQSDGTGAAGGYLIIARVIDLALVTELAQVTNVAFTVTRVRDGQATGPEHEALAALSPAAPERIQPAGPDQLTADVLFSDVLGQPCLVARIAKDRAVVAQGERTIRLLLAVSGSAGVAVILLAALLLDRLILSRLLQLKKEIDAVTSTGDCQRRITQNGNDEIGGLADATNAMLASIVKAETARQESEQRLAARVTELEAAAGHIHHLQGLLPVCAWCKRVRDDANYWRQIDEYLHLHSDVEFTHGICPDCSAKAAERLKSNPGRTPPPPGGAEPKPG